MDGLVITISERLMAFFKFNIGALDLRADILMLFVSLMLVAIAIVAICYTNLSKA